MSKKTIKAIKVAEELGLYLKVVTSTKFFDTYNSFFNIFGEIEEPCRRILILTKYKELEEVNDEYPGKEISEPIIINNNIWLREFPLTTNPNKINLEDYEVDYEFYEKIEAYYKMNNKY